MRFISHRGAKGLAKENSLDSIKKASSLPLAYIEFDINFTKNNVLVLHHDATTPSGKKISDYTLKTIQREIPAIATLEQALKACEDVPALVESKTKGGIARALPILKNYPSAAIASFISDEVLSARINTPHNKTFLLQHYHPFGIIKKAKKIDAYGIGVNKNWLLVLPYYYWNSQRHNIAMYCYTANNPLLVGLLVRFFPKLLICTDEPQRFTKNEEIT